MTDHFTGPGRAISRVRYLRVCVPDNKFWTKWPFTYYLACWFIFTVYVFKGEIQGSKFNVTLQKMFIFGYGCTLLDVVYILHRQRPAPNVHCTFMQFIGCRVRPVCVEVIHSIDAAYCVFTRDSIYAIARICYGNSVCLSVCLSVRPSVWHTGGSVKNGWS